MDENLYMKKLFSELEFLTVDHDFKKQMFDKYQIEFNQKIVDFLDDNPEIKKEYESIVNQANPQPMTPEEIEKQIQEEAERSPEEQQEIEDKKKEIEDALKEEQYAENLEKRTFTEDPDIKRIYREIVKMTHPDKIKRESNDRQTALKKYYLEATEAYNSQNLYQIVRIATLLNLDIGDLSDENLDRLENDLRRLRGEVKQIESTLVWKYFEELRDNVQRKILIKQFVLTFIHNHKGESGQAPFKF
jgi:hypothetical protein